MIDDDDVETEPGRLRQRLMAGGAAIDGDQQFRAARGQRADGLDIRPIAFENAVGDMDDRIEPAVRRKRASVADEVAPSTS